MPLTALKPGEKARIVRIAGTEAARKHLGDLGFVPGVVIGIVNAAGDNMIVAIHDSRIAVNGDVTRHVLVEACA